MFDVGAVAALPDVMLRGDEFPHNRRPRLVATGYGGSVEVSFSGSSAYLATAGIAAGVLDGAFTLYSTTKHDRLLQARGAAWKSHRLLRGERPAGFKFSAEFSAHLWRRHLPALAGVDVISNFQLFSEDFFRRRADYDVRAYFYLDGTLHDYLRGYREHDVADIDPSTADRVMEVERSGYEQADGLAVMSEFSAQTLVSGYGIPRERIAVVLPGANLTDQLADSVIEARAQRESREFTVGFIGVHPERKGLPKLAAAVSALRSDNVPVRLQVVGRCPEHVAAMDGVDALGFISKATEPDRFAAAMARIDLGAQLSTAELFGIAVLEFLRCGIPVIATEVGGVTDILGGGGSVGVPVDIGVDELAATIGRIIGDKHEYQELVDAAGARSRWARWSRTVEHLDHWLSNPAS